MLLEIGLQGNPFVEELCEFVLHGCGSRLNASFLTDEHPEGHR